VGRKRGAYKPYCSGELYRPTGVEKKKDRAKGEPNGEKKRGMATGRGRGDKSSQKWKEKEK